MKHRFGSARSFLRQTPPAGTTRTFCATSASAVTDEVDANVVLIRRPVVAEIIQKRWPLGPLQCRKTLMPYATDSGGTSVS